MIEGLIKNETIYSTKNEEFTTFNSFKAMMFFTDFGNDLHQNISIV